MRVAHREVRQRFAIEMNVGLAKRRHKPAVRHAVDARAGVDAHNPQAAQVTAAIAAVAVGVPQRVHHRFVGAPPHLVARTEMPLGALEHLLVMLAAIGPGLNSGHAGSPGAA